MLKRVLARRKTLATSVCAVSVLIGAGVGTWAGQISASFPKRVPPPTAEAFSDLTPRDLDILQERWRHLESIRTTDVVLENDIRWLSNLMVDEDETESEEARLLGIYWASELLLERNMPADFREKLLDSFYMLLLWEPSDRLAWAAANASRESGLTFSMKSLERLADEKIDAIRGPVDQP